MAEKESPMNEVAEAVRDAKRVREAAEQAGGETEARSKRWPVAAVAVGIGSAAVAAALIYAGRNRGRK